MSDEQTIKVKKSKDRSVAYPGINIEKAIELSAKLSSELGKGPYSRSDAAHGIGHLKLSGPAARKIAALVHYGLLERSGNTYAQSVLAQEIVSPVNEEEKLVAIGKAVRNPKLFSTLLQQFQGQALPTMLGNILIRKGISPSVSEEAANIFRESLKFSGLLHNGVVSFQEDKISDQINEESDDDRALSKNILPPLDAESPKNPAGAKVHTFNFPGGIQLVIPSDPAVDEAILDGQLREIRSGLKKFSEDYFQKNEGGE